MFEDINELSIKPEVGNSTKPVLATADQLVKELEFALETCWFTKKNSIFAKILPKGIRGMNIGGATKLTKHLYYEF